MRSIVRAAAGVCALLYALISALAIGLQLGLPSRYYVVQGNRFTPGEAFGVAASGLVDQIPLEVYSRAGNSYTMNLTLPGGIRVKEVAVQVVARNYVVPGGMPFGIKMFTDGVMVVGLSDLEEGGRMINPAKTAGIKTGDILIAIDGQPIYKNEDVTALINNKKGQPVSIALRRGDQTLYHILTPALTGDGYKAGIWVRDSSAGIGTLTYFNPTTGIFAGLGHAVCDVDTGDIMPLSSGQAVEVTITGVTPGQSGSPGELKGIFSGSGTLGELYLNSEAGVYGYSSGHARLSGAAIPMALPHETQPGPAEIYTTITGSEPQSYAIQIERVNTGEKSPTKNMVIRITDPRLLESTGGIVQGMSGSPIIQNGRLVGAVTHVFVNDPARGYGIFAENMERASRSTDITGAFAA